jgi:hypothetical protein
VDASSTATSADVAGAEVLVAVHDHRSALRDAGADAVRPLATLAPIGAAHEPGAAERIDERRIGFLVEDDAARIGQHQCVAGFGDVVVEPIDLGGGDLHEVRVALAAKLERARIDDGRRVVAGRIDGIIERAAAP